MPSLSELLNDTMVFVAAKGAGKEPQSGIGEVVKPPLPQGDVDDPERLAIWHWETALELNELRNLSVIARGMGNVRMKVCEKIRFEDVAVTSVAGAKKNLDLESTFLLKEFQLESGSISPFIADQSFIPGTHFLYPLQSELDESFLRVFGYDFPDGFAGDPVPIDSSQLNHSDFMPSSNNGGSIGQQGQKVTASVAKPRVVVFISMVCCKERADFEPGGILGAGRIIPHIMVMCNQALAQTHGTVHIQRPTSTHMYVESAAPTAGAGHEHHHGDEEHNHDSTMNPEMHSGFWADKNAVLGEAPFWDDLFDCYELGVIKDTRWAVRSDVGSRTLSNVVMDLSSISLSLPFTHEGKPYKERDIVRVARQGAFDNLHVAPTMKSDDKPAGEPYNLDKIIMAPFCEHDCLHTHWRWGTGWLAAKQNYGWSKPSSTDEKVPGRPYVDAGSPMVPHNQKVSIQSINAATFKYKAVAIGPSSSEPTGTIPAGTYTFINHHGSGYSLSIGTKEFIAAKTLVGAACMALGEPKLAFVDTLSSNSANLYWHLRYGGVAGGLLNDDIVQERLKMEDASGRSTLSRIHNE